LKDTELNAVKPKNSNLNYKLAIFMLVRELKSSWCAFTSGIEHHIPFLKLETLHAMVAIERIAHNIIYSMQY
jgi:hypothetical protein